MAGTIVAGTLSDGTSSTSSTNIIFGSAKAWVNFNGTLASPGTGRASYNISSVTKISTGRFQINFTTAMTDINYSIIGICSCDGQFGVGGSIKVLNIEQTSTFLTTSCIIGTATVGATPAMIDTTITSVAVFR